MALSSDVTAEVHESGTSAFLRSHRNRSALRYGGLYAYDAVGKEIRARLESGPDSLSILVDDSGAMYPITVDPFIEKDYLLARIHRFIQVDGVRTAEGCEGVTGAIIRA